MMNLISEISPKLFNNNICIENIFILPLVGSCDKLSESFRDAFDSHYKEFFKAYELNTDEILKNYNQLKKDDDILELFSDYNFEGVMIEYTTPLPRNFVFTDKKDHYSSYSCGWGVSRVCVVIQPTFEEAINKVIQEQQNLVKERFEYEKNNEI